MIKIINHLTLVGFSALAIILSGCAAAPAEEAQSGPVAAEAQAVLPATPTAVPTSTPAPTSTPVPAATSTGLPTEIVEEPVSPIAPAQEDSTMPDTLPNVIPGSEAAVNAAIEDLSRQQNIPAAEISVTSVEATEWSDASLGCPQEGFMYAQVITPGYLIVLEAHGQSFEYHTDLQGKSVVLCQK